MSQSRNGQSLSDGNRPKSRGTYTGERLKSLRPETHREVVRLLAEPREHVSYREICRRCHVTDDTVKAVEQREAIPTATRKQELLSKALRIANKAADRVEDQIDSANITQAAVAFGVTADKINLLSGDPSIHIQHSIQHPDGNANRLYDRLNELAVRLSQPRTIEADAVQPLGALPAFQNGETFLILALRTVRAPKRKPEKAREAFGQFRTADVRKSA